MRIAVPIISRGRSTRLIGVVQALHNLSSGDHEIVFGLRCDEGDRDTIHAADLLRAAEVPMFVRTGPRPDTVGIAWNDLMCAITDATVNDPIDAWMPWGDRLFPCTPGWDAKIAEALLTKFKHILWWRCGTEPDLTQPIIPAMWFKAAGGRVFPEVFPFWFTDTWLAEVYEFAWALPLQGLGDVVHAGQRGRTHRLRDLHFWSEFFEISRPVRMQEGLNMRHRLALPDPGAAVMDEIQLSMAAAFRAGKPRLSELEARFGDRTIPDERYLAIKAQAEILMKIAA